jgi:transcriptional regulator with XRE-family HTH domain
MTSVIEFSKDELRQLRYRLGWSQAEMARNLRVEMAVVSGCESGAVTLPAELKSSLIRILQQADSNADSCQRRAIAEVLMDQKGLSQIHNFDCDPEQIITKGRA